MARLTLRRVTRRPGGGSGAGLGANDRPFHCTGSCGSGRVPRRRMLELGEEAARHVLLGLEQFGRREDRAERHALGLRQALDLGARLVGEPRRDDLVELGDVLAPAGAGGRTSGRRGADRRSGRASRATASRCRRRRRGRRGRARSGTPTSCPRGPATRRSRRRPTPPSSSPIAALRRATRAPRRGLCPASRAASAAVEAGEGGQAGGVRRLMAAQPQRLALGLAHHVQQAAQRQQGELADRPRRGVHLHRKRRDLDRRRAAGAGQRARSRPAPRTARRRPSVEQLGEAGAAGVARDRAPASAWRC